MAASGKSEGAYTDPCILCILNVFEFGRNTAGEVAALNDAKDTLTLFCVNRELSRDLSTDIAISGFVPEKAKSQVLYTSSIYDQNDEVNPEAVRPKTESLTVKSPRFSYKFRHESVTVIQFKRR